MRKKCDWLLEASYTCKRFAAAWFLELWSEDKVSDIPAPRTQRKFKLFRKTKGIVGHDRILNAEEFV